MRPLILSATFVAGLAACEGGPRVVQPDSPSKIGVVYPDLPAPLNFTYTENISDSSPTGAFRVVRQTLHGPGQTVGNAAKFYKDTFPTHGWTLENDESAKDGPARLTFAKKSERARIEIKEENRTDVVIAVKVNRKD